MELRPLPSDVYQRAGIPPEPNPGQSRVDAMHRVIAYRAALIALSEESRIVETLGVSSVTLGPVVVAPEVRVVHIP